MLQFVLAWCVVTLAQCITIWASDRSWERQAVEAGHAEYYTDHHGKRQWRWLPPKEKP